MRPGPQCRGRSGLAASASRSCAKEVRGGCGAPQRAEHLFLHDEPLPLLEDGQDLVLWTFAGGGANVLLARMLEAELGGRVVSRNTSLTLKEEAGKSASAVRAVFERWRAEGRPKAEDARVHAEGAVRGRVSKFQVCLPEGLLLDLLVTAAVDVEGARRVVGGGLPKRPLLTDVDGSGREY